MTILELENCLEDKTNKESPERDGINPNTYSHLLNLAKRLVRDVGAYSPEDYVQTTLVTFLGEGKSFEEKKFGYLATILRRSIINEKRSRRSSETLINPEKVNEIADNKTKTSDNLEDSETSKQIMTYIEEEIRAGNVPMEAFYMTSVLEIQPPVAAEMLRITRSNLHTRTSRARDKLKEHFVADY